MKPIFVFASCRCAPKGKESLQALIQKECDKENFVHFDMICLQCGRVCKIKESLDECLLLPKREREVMNFLNSSESRSLLLMALTGKTYSIPEKCESEVDNKPRRVKRKDL
jgi:hypothetical protein